MLRIYVDGEAVPSIALTLLQLASVGAAGAKGDSHSDVSPFSAELFGKNAQTGGVWSTMRIPFQSTVRVTIEQAPSGVHGGTFWGIIRGVEALTISLSDIDLPPSARVRVLAELIDEGHLFSVVQDSEARADSAGALTVSLGFSSPAVVRVRLLQ